MTLYVIKVLRQKKKNREILLIKNTFFKELKTQKMKLEKRRSICLFMQKIGNEKSKNDTKVIE